jgi:AcrR family transcriptional regulator
LFLTERSVYAGVTDERNTNVAVAMRQRRKPSDVRRVQILEAAAAVIAERGLSDIRISDVATRAGASPALVVYYFGTKERLLADALSFAEDRFYGQTSQELEDIPDATGRLLRLIELSSQPEDASHDWLLWVELWARAIRDADVAARRELLDQRWRESIATIIRDGQAGREFDGSVDADDLALRLAAMIDGLAIQVILADPEVDPKRMRAICAEMASRELRFTVPARRPAKRRPPGSKARATTRKRARVDAG